jgi:phage FluMu gp28-like protein
MLIFGNLRSLKPSDWISQRDLLFSDAQAAKEARNDEVSRMAKTPSEFFRNLLGFKPTAYQQELITFFEENQFIAARWCRQSGKSWIVSALLLNYALQHNDAYIAVVGPSWRQTKLNLRRITYFLRKIPKERYQKPSRTILRFTNGSVIEAFPNSPDTIRGPTLNAVWWDEANFTPNDTGLYDAILFTLGTTNGKLIATSTPWNTDSIFWKMCNHKDWDFKRSHVPIEQATEPNGPWKAGSIEKIKKQFGEDPTRWRREMLAEWAEDENVWLPQSLIVKCIGTIKNCGYDLQPWNTDGGYTGNLFAGLDLAQTKDYAVFSVFDMQNDKLFLRHLKIFQQPTKYATVLGYLKQLQDRWDEFQKIRVDITREGPSLISDMEDAQIQNAEGVVFSTSRKSEMANLLKQRMLDDRLFFPYLTWEHPYRGDICTELNIEKYHIRKDGTTGYSHPSGTHDDVFWSLALGVYGTVKMKPLDLETIRLG